MFAVDRLAVDVDQVGFPGCVERQVSGADPTEAGKGVVQGGYRGAPPLYSENAGDERVRPSHEALDGTRQRWDDPPAEGHPGEPINCRCIAEPVLGPLFDDLG